MQVRVYMDSQLFTILFLVLIKEAIN
jgi:hypothetical protein